MRSLIAALLDRYQTSDPQEAEHREACIKLVASAEEGHHRLSKGPWCRDHFVPGHFTVSAFVVDREFQNTLLVYHRKLQRWVQPGGHIEFEQDATPWATALREVVEECEIPRDELQFWPQLPGQEPALLDLDIHEIPQRPGEPAHRHYDLRFATVLTGSPELAWTGSDSGIANIRWWPLAQLGQALRDAGEDADASILRASDRLAQALLAAGHSGPQQT